jgi:membrane protein YqaA with SNARE-associated domain
MQEAAQRRRLAVDSIVFVSASVGLPPFAVISLLAGQVGMSLPRFLVIGSVGRLIRFSAVALGVEQVLHLL